MAILPTPGACVNCGNGGGGGGGDAIDVENAVLCDIVDGDIVGTALAVYTYDDAGIPTGAPTFVIPGTNDPYVPVGILQPCGAEHIVSEILCDVQADNTAQVFKRIETVGPNGSVGTFDVLLDGSPYVPTGTVGVCDPYSTCVPTPDVDLAGTCGPGEAANSAIVTAAAGSPLANSVFNDDPTADPLCGGQWDRPADAPTFVVAETFRNTTFDQPGPVTQANWAGGPFLTAGPPTNDGAGAGWIRLSDGSYASGGVWQVPTPFSTADGMNAAVTLASHDGTTPGGDGQYFFFSDGSAPVQSTIVGGFGNLGLNNIDAGVFAVVLDEYGQSCSCGQAIPDDPNPGSCGFCSNSIAIVRAGPSRVGASCACCTLISVPLAPKAINQTTRAVPLRLLVSVVEEAGQTYVSASVDWNDGAGPVQYINRFNVTSCITVPPTLRMGLVMNSGGAYQAIKEARDAVARPAGVSNWRAFPIETDPIPVCVTSLNITASVDLTFLDDGTQTVGNANPEAYFWLVNIATNTIVDMDQLSALPAQIGNVQTLDVSALVPVADLPNLRLYVGAESRDENGEYATLWENLDINVAGIGCPATPVRTLAISAPCPIDVRIIGGSGDAPAPVTVVNTPATFEDEPVCVTVGGVQQTAFRREVRGADGSITVTFTGTGGVEVAPDGPYTPGVCRDGNLALGPVCWVTNPPLGGSNQGFMTINAAGDPVLYDTLGEVVPDGDYVIVICPLRTQQFAILCDSGNADHQFQRWYVDSPIVGESDAQWDFELDGSTPYVPVGPVGLCGGGSNDNEVVALCDFLPNPPSGFSKVPFLRRYLYDDAGALVGTLDTGLDGTTPYAPTGAFQAPCDVFEFDVNETILCDSTGTTFIRRARYLDGGFIGTEDVLLDEATAYAAVGAVTAGPCGGVADNGVDVESFVVCDSAAPTPNRLILNVIYDADTGAYVSQNLRTLAGAVAVPVGALQICPTVTTTDTDFVEEILCDANGTSFIRLFRFNSATGALISSTNTTLAGAAFAPVGVVGLCSECCPIEIGRGCTNVGSGVYTALRLANGTITLIDSVSGAAVLPANIIACTSDDTARTLTAQHRLVGDADAPWTPGADVVGVLTSVTFTVLSGTATVTDQNGTVAAGLPAGLSTTWEVEDDNTLTGPQSIDAVGGSTYVVWTVR
jgi:hypothetical protein